MNIAEGLNIFGTKSCKGEEEYEKSLGRVFNLSPLSRTPQLFVYPLCTRDVVCTVKWCKEENLSLSILCGGQNPTNASLQGEVVLDLKYMSHVHVNPTTKQAVVAGGTLVHLLDYELALHGLALPSPNFSKLGVAGTALGGGWGYLTKRYGLLSDAVAEVQLVTAAHEVLQVNKNQHRELFWALTRCAGAGTFGVVTSITFDLMDAPEKVFHGFVWWPLSALKSVATAIRKHKAEWSKNFVMYPIIVGTRLACLVFCASGSAEGIPFLENVFHEIEVLPTTNEVSDKTYLEAQTALDSFFQPQQCYQNAHFVDDLSEELVLLAVARMDLLGPEERERTKIFFVNYFNDTGYLLLVHASWTDPTMQESMTLWSNSLVKEASKGDKEQASVPNYAPNNTRLSRVFCSDDKLHILKLKTTYDPENFFDSNVWKLPPK